MTSTDNQQEPTSHGDPDHAGHRDRGNAHWVWLWGWRWRGLELAVEVAVIVVCWSSCGGGVGGDGGGCGGRVDGGKGVVCGRVVVLSVDGRVEMKCHGMQVGLHNTNIFPIEMIGIPLDDISTSAPPPQSFWSQQEHQEQQPPPPTGLSRVEGTVSSLWDV